MSAPRHERNPTALVEDSTASRHDESLRADRQPQTPARSVFSTEHSGEPGLSCAIEFELPMIKECTELLGLHHQYGALRRVT